MELSTPPPKKRRRRWLIVSVVLLLVSTVVWWNWPRGDARFVGKWEFQFMGAVGGGIPFELELKPNGIAVLRKLSAVGPTYTRWAVDGDALVVGLLDEPANSNLSSLASLLQRYLGIDVMTDRGEKYIVSAVGANEISLYVPEGDYASRYKLVRVPE